MHDTPTAAGGASDDSGSTDPRQELYAAVAGLDGALVELSQSGPHPALGRAQVHMAALVRSLLQLLARPQMLDVREEHRDTAVLLVTSYLDRAESHDLLLQMLVDVDDRGSGDPEFRLAVVAALAQLCADALVLAVVSVPGASEQQGDFEPAAVEAACRQMLSRLVLARREAGL